MVMISCCAGPADQGASGPGDRRTCPTRDPFPDVLRLLGNVLIQDPAGDRRAYRLFTEQATTQSLRGLAIAEAATLPALPAIIKEDIVPSDEA